MDYVKGYRVEENKDGDGYTIIFFLDQNYTEFASELDSQLRAEKTNQNIMQFVHERFPDKKITKAKFFVGSLLVMSFVLTANPAAAAQTTDSGASQQVSHQNVHIVKSGETLSHLAKAYNVTVDQIRQLNQLRTDTIFVGQAIEIPVENTVSYQVKSGDTLSRIAKQYNTTVDQIRQANRLTSDIIFVGQILKVPTSQITQTQTPTSVPSQTHIVKAGESLSLLAKNYNTTVQAIKSANQLTSDMIFVGQTLTIPSNQTQFQTPGQADNYSVKPGDTLSAIAKRYNVTVNQIQTANNLTGTTIYVGQNLKIPQQNQTTPAPITNDQLRTGVQSPEVTTLQTNLKALDYFNDQTTGFFGIVTEQSVRAFQADYGLKQTGVVDKQTEEQINRAVVKKRLVADLGTYTGVPYVWGGASPSGFDCSGFVHFMFNKHGVDMVRTTSSSLYNMGDKVSRANLQPGDLVYFAVNQPGVISHVGFYTGNNSFVSATSSKGIWEYSMDNSYWSKFYVGANRIY